MPTVFRRLGELYAERSMDIVALFGEGERTLIHGDTHSGNLFVDGGRTGFYDWAVAGRGPGVRDVAYFLCNSLPVEIRRAEEEPRCRPGTGPASPNAASRSTRTPRDEQYRLFSVYSWIAAASTAAMGAQWQPIDVMPCGLGQHHTGDRRPRCGRPARRAASPLTAPPRSARRVGMTGPSASFSSMASSANPSWVKR